MLNYDKFVNECDSYNFDIELFKQVLFYGFAIISSFGKCINVD